MQQHSTDATWRNKEQTDGAHTASSNGSPESNLFAFFVSSELYP